MTHWEKIRENASQLRHEIAAGIMPDELAAPEAICAAAVEHLGLCLIPEHPESANLRGAQAVLEDDVIFINNDLKGWYRSYCVAHEIGHARLHGHRISCSATEIDETKASEDCDSGAEKAVGYGAGERLEREANLFAIEFLLTCESLRRAFDTTDARAIAEKLKVPIETVAGQLMRALLIPPGQLETQPRSERKPDDSQKSAAESTACPLLVSAGPGTGKTQTLAGRISFLIGRGVSPGRILALTFSNKAAEEMRDRVAERHPLEATSIDMMTFHAFGLNLLRKYWQRAGLELHSKIIDKIEALLYLEKNLASLGLEHFRSLHEPTRNLPDILGVISRAKDELCPPEMFAKLADEMLERTREGGDEKAIVKAEKVVEAARVYSYYQNYLEREKLLDFGDLIFRAVTLLERDQSVRAAVAGSYDAILVDEFQDINRASGILLKEISGDGRGLWAVGDIRQSIYRWRGASPLNIGQFAADFPNSRTLALETNYRSVPDIVSLFSRFADQMKAGAGVFHDWSANRGTSAPAVTLTVSPTIEEEADAIAATIRDNEAGDSEFSDHAVICRTHKQLVTLSDKLSERGIPVFYLGDVFEREEVRDLLSLLDLSISKSGHSLVRVALLPEYAIPEADVRRILEESRTRANGFAEVLTDEAYDSEISPRGIGGWHLLRAQLEKLGGAETAWSFLAAYLFAESRFLERFLESDDVARMTARLAIFQFANFARGMEGRFEEHGSEGIRAFLRYVRRLAWFKEDKDLAQIPEAAAGLNAVRMLTVHAAKGLEFNTVFLPYLGAGRFPSSRRGARCSVPDGMIPNGGDFHDEEEECLFFVAMSRARDGLHLSRSRSYGKTSSNESRHLTALEGFLPAARIVDARNSDERPMSTADSLRRSSFYAAELDRYNRCPREFYYTNDRRLKSRDEDSVYRSFHNLLREVLKEECSGVPEDAAFERFERKWLESGIGDHAYSPFFLEIAAEILARPPRVGAGEGAEVSFTVNIAGCAVNVSADGITEEDGKVFVDRMKTGKKPSRIEEDVDALLLEAVEKANPGRFVVVRKTYLMSDESVDVPITAKFRENALNRYADAIAGINNREFPVTSKDENCPNCPHYFICPAGE
ncbi:MAG: UvrD-helicase domain-containing protein [Acidobacteria bacterium]|nr:UvrD-helicase domain-containing protein [Acidobacteriota bacterium]